MRILSIIFLFSSLNAVGQTLPDSVIIIQNIYANNFSGIENIYSSNNFQIILDGKKYILGSERISKAKILDLLVEITTSNNTDNSLAKYDVDTNWIKSNPRELLSYYSEKGRIIWNDQQKEFILKKLTDISLFKKELNDYQSIGGSYLLHHNYKNEFIVKFYSNGKITNEVKSRKYVGGYKMPWINQSGDTIYNINIEKKLKSIVSAKEKIKAPLTGNKLKKYLVNKIVNYFMPSLYELSAHTYKKEIDELNSDFEITSFEEVYGRGRYIWDEPKTMKIILKNKLMYDNVDLIFLASKSGNTIYSRDSIKKDYSEYINRVQSIKFISDYLKTNPDSRLDIYYFNDKGINKYNIDGVNKNPTKWIKHDAFMTSIKKFDTVELKPTYANEDAIIVSRQLYCGCNYRFEKSYIEKAIFFEIHDANNNSSIWFLLPDNNVLLYIMDNDTALNFKRSDFNNNREFGIIYPCVLVDTNGLIIKR